MYLRMMRLFILSLSMLLFCIAALFMYWSI
jgi:hypothetical protein